ncbi:MAG: hypothetical protein ABII85_04370 [Bacillota bacterium]
MNSKRILISLITGALLGIICIIGAQLRTQEHLENLYLFSFWFNRLLMGLVIGLANKCFTLPKALSRGVLIGAFVSFAFYSATGFADITGFIVGILYGAIIEYIAFKFAK